MLATEVDRGSVEKMVRSFYAMLVEDDLVGPFFIKTLGDDLKNDKWNEFNKTLDRFWMMMMTGEPIYMGDPFLPHTLIGKLTVETFDRWLELFNKHVHEHFVPEIADKFYKKSEILAQQFIEKLALEKEDG